MRQLSGRSIQGTTTTELAVSLPIFMIVTIFSINTAALTFAADFCDRTCKDCARAAGQMSTPDQAVNAMNAAAAAHPVDNFFFQQLSPELLVYQDYNYSSANPTPAYGSTPEYVGENGQNNTTPAKPTDEWHENKVSKKETISAESINAILADPNQTITPGPYVVVRTTMIMRIPVSLDFFGSKLFAGNVPGNSQLFQLASIYTFPLTNTYAPL